MFSLALPFVGIEGRGAGIDAAVVHCWVFHGLFDIRLDMIERMLGDDVTEQIL